MIRKRLATLAVAAAILLSEALVLPRAVAHAFARENGPEASGVIDPPAASSGIRHSVPWSRLQALSGRRVREPQVARVLSAPLRRVLGARYADFDAWLVEDEPLRLEAHALVGQGVVPGSFGFRGAFFAFGSRGEVLVVLKSGVHGSRIERFGSLEPLKDPELLHAYREFLGIDE